MLASARPRGYDGDVEVEANILASTSVIGLKAEAVASTSGLRHAEDNARGRSRGVYMPTSTSASGLRPIFGPRPRLEH